MPPARVSEHAIHVGVLVGNLEAAMKFYNGILGFQEFWRGSAATSKTLSWVNMRVPDGTDYIELMLYDQMPAPDRRGSAHHLCLVVPDADKAVAALNARPARTATRGRSKSGPASTGSVRSTCSIPMARASR